MKRARSSSTSCPSLKRSVVRLSLRKRWRSRRKQPQPASRQTPPNTNACPHAYADSLHAQHACRQPFCLASAAQQREGRVRGGAPARNRTKWRILSSPPERGGEPRSRIRCNGGGGVD